MKSLFTFAIFLASTFAAFGQERSDAELYNMAREQAAAGNYALARQSLDQLLTRTPMHHDARVLSGRVYGWTKQYDRAEKELEKVLADAPNYSDAAAALIDIYLWSENYARVIDAANDYVQKHGWNSVVALRKTVALISLENFNEAERTVNEVLAKEPGNETALDLLATIREAKLKYQVRFGYQVDWFSSTFDPAHYRSLQLQRRQRWGSAIARVNYANRVNTSGMQGELDVYPKFSKSVYGYFNYGYSDAVIFPEHRVGGELFSKVSTGVEASLGVRFMKFQPDVNVTIYTGSLSLYAGQFLFTLRPFVTPDSDAGTGASGNLMVRKYFRRADDYLSFLVGVGYSPEERRYQTGSGITADKIYLLNSQRFGILFSKSLRKNFGIQANADLARQEQVYKEGEYIFITSLGLAISKRF